MEMKGPRVVTGTEDTAYEAGICISTRFVLV